VKGVHASGGGWRLRKRPRQLAFVSVGGHGILCCAPRQRLRPLTQRVGASIWQGTTE